MAMDSHPEAWTSEVYRNSTEDAVQLEHPSSGVSWQLVAYYCVGVIGTLDNGFTLIVIFSSKTMRQQVNNMLILNQSATDWVASILLLINPPLLKPDPPAPAGIAGELWCRLWANNYPLVSCFVASTLNLVAITLERYLEVVKPLRYKELFTPFRAKVAIVGVWLGGCVFMTLPFVGPSGVVNGICYRYSLWPNPVGATISGVMTFLVMFLIPVLIMTFCYTRMMQVFRQRVVPVNQSAGEKRRAEKYQRIQQNIMKTFIIVAVAFSICWSPNLTSFLLFNLGVRVNLASTYHQCLIILSYSNCIINPIIYSFQYQQFKEQARKLLKLTTRVTDSLESNTTDSSLVD